MIISGFCESADIFLGNIMQISRKMRNFVKDFQFSFTVLPTIVFSHLLIMRPDLQFLKERFDFLNKQCFAGKLKPVTIELSNAGSFLGRLYYKVRRTLRGAVSYNFKIRISVRYDLEETEITDTLLHEMIHYYILSNGIKDTSAHGKVFLSIMNDFNSRFGYNMSVSHKVGYGTEMARQKQEERKQKNEVIKRHYVGVVELNDGTVCVIQAASTRVVEIDRLLKRHYSIKSVKWYGSVSPFWNRYPNSITPKLYAIEPFDLQRELEQMVALQI